MKKVILGIVAVMLAAVGFAVWWGMTHLSGIGTATESKVVTVDRGAVRQIVMASGTIAANYEVDIKCKASGEVINLPYDVSDAVQKGALVMQLDPIDEKHQVEQVNAALVAAQCRLSDAQQAVKIAEQTLITDTRQAEVTLHSAEVDANELRSKAQRSKQLLEGKLLSLEEWEASDAAALRAEASVDAAKNAIEALKVRPISIERDRNEVTLAEIAVETAQTDLKEAELRLKETNVMAPIDGVVTTRPVQVGSIVSSGITNVGGGSSIMTLSDLSRLFVQAPVNEADIGRVALNQKVVIKCDAFQEKKFEGRITRIAAKGVTQQSVVTFAVKIEILGLEGRRHSGWSYWWMSRVGTGKELLKPEMTADVEIVIAEKENVLRVPSEAVLTRKKDQSKYVLVPAEGAATVPATTSASATTPAPATGPSKKAAGVERTVTVGADDGTYCEILGGLKEGDKVVVEMGNAGDWAKLKANNSGSD